MYRIASFTLATAWSAVTPFFCRSKLTFSANRSLPLGLFSSPARCRSESSASMRFMAGVTVPRSMSRTLS